MEYYNKLIGNDDIKLKQLGYEVITMENKAMYTHNAIICGGKASWMDEVCSSNLLEIFLQ